MGKSQLDTGPTIDRHIAAAIPMRVHAWL